MTAFLSFVRSFFNLKKNLSSYTRGIKTRITIVSLCIHDEVIKNLSCANFGDAFYGASNSEGPVLK